MCAKCSAFSLRWFCLHSEDSQPEQGWKGPQIQPPCSGRMVPKQEMKHRKFWDAAAWGVFFLFAFCVFCSILCFPECFYICPVLGPWWRIPCLRGQNSCTSLTQTTPLSCRDSIDTFFCKNSQCHTTKEESNINRVPAAAFGYSTQFCGGTTICIKIEMQRNTVMFKISEGALFLVVTMWCLREFCFLVLLCSVFAFRYFAMQFQCLVFFHSNHFAVFTGDENKLLVKNEK